MARLIIDFPDDLHCKEALDLVSRVVAQGRVCRISKADKARDHFCWLTTFKENSVFNICKKEIQVITRRKKLGQTSDSFIIRRSE
jgi:hypothetical protein